MGKNINELNKLNDKYGKIDLILFKNSMFKKRKRKYSMQRYKINVGACCLKCGTNKKLTRHHYLNNNYLANKFMIVCRNCHNKIHKGQIKE